MLEIDDLVNVEHLRDLAADGKGFGVRTVILDTGVDDSHPDLTASIAETRAIVRNGARFQCVSVSDGDPVGHGTACAGIIHSIAPEAEIHSVRVMGRDATGTIEQLIEGLRWAIDQDYDVINLSLGTLQRRSAITLHELIDKAYFKGQIVVAAANNQRRVSFPAQFASLVAVDSQAFKNNTDFHYCLGQPVELVAHGIYVKAPAPGGGYRWYTGTSFACPHISGLATRLKSQIPKLTLFQLKSLLWCLRADCVGHSRVGTRETDRRGHLLPKRQ